MKPLFFIFTTFSIFFCRIELYASEIERTITPKNPIESTSDTLRAKPSLPLMIGQMILIGFHGSSSKDVSDIAENIHEGRVGGVILFSNDFTNRGLIRNIIDKKQTTKLIKYLQSKATIPLFIGVDQEGGLVQRFKNITGIPNTLSAAKLSQQGKQTTERQMQSLGKALKEMGVNLNFAPVIDLNINPFNPIIGGVDRSYGKTTKAVVPHALSVMQSFIDNNIIFALKHFPGHGSSTVDSHYGLPDITQTWRRNELDPYRKLLPYSKDGMVLVGHLFNARIDTEYPSTLSYKTVTLLLREELQWDGVIITDDLQMKAMTNHYSLSEIIIGTVNAGVDILLFGNNIEYDPDLPIRIQKIIINAIRQGKIRITQIEASYNRIMKLKNRTISPKKS